VPASLERRPKFVDPFFMTLVQHGHIDERPGVSPVRRNTGWQDIEAGAMRSPASALRMAGRFVRANREADASVTRSLLGLARYRLHGRWIWAHPRTRIRGLKNLETHGLLKIGIDFSDIAHPDDNTWLRIDGRMSVGPRCKIGRGGRIHVGPRAKVTWGEGVWANAGVLIHVVNGLDIGDDTLLGWGAQIIDDNFHTIVKPGACEEPTGAPVRIGNHVWVGNRVSITKGAQVPDGCVVAANSLVTRKFEEPNCLIAGSPAEVVRRGISWR
jgi:acetyltransferase-like isoleucine patch superfamily enzyme